MPAAQRRPSVTRSRSRGTRWRTKSHGPGGGSSSSGSRSWPRPSRSRTPEPNSSRQPRRSCSATPVEASIDCSRKTSRPDPTTDRLPTRGEPRGIATMADDDIHQRIDDLVAEEHRLRSNSSPDDAARARLRELEVALDRTWDLLRRRQAIRDAGGNPDEASEAPASQVESYLQ